MSNIIKINELQERFFNDPQWKDVEELILNYIEPLKDMGTIDLKQPAEHVKAEIIGRTLAYNKLTEFLNSVKIVSRPLQKMNNPFR